MWYGPKLKFARSRVKLEDVAALLYENWGGERWGHYVRCSYFDYFSTPRRGPDACFTIFPPLPIGLGCNPETDDQIEVSARYERFILRPSHAVPEGEVWLVPFTVPID